MTTKRSIYTLTTVIALLVFAACSKKDDEFLYKGDIFPITITGYNGSNEELIVKVDTSTFKSLLQANSSISQKMSYTFIGSRDVVNLSIFEKSSGKLVFEKELKREEKKITLNIVYIDGKIITAAPPAVNPNTNKVGLYIVNKENNDLADLFLYDENVELLTTIGRDISPNQWVYLDIDFTTTKKEAFQLPIFFKAGSLQAEEYGYFNNNMWSSYVEGNPFFPTDGTKGQVRSFIITHDGSYVSAIQIQ